jgi:threonine/homoserine/homoserine lactone efflux protein
MLLKGCIKAMVSGFLISTPLGPVAFIILRQALKNQLPLALSAGFGASLGDLFWGFSSLLGVQWSKWFLYSYQKEFQIGGGLFLMIVAGFLFYNPPQPDEKASSNDPFWVFSLSFFLTLLNPLNFTAFIALFSTFHLTPPLDDFFTISLWSAFIGFGASLWWMMLSIFVFWGRKRFSMIDVFKMNQVITWIIFALGLYAFFSSGIVPLPVSRRIIGD